MSDLAYFGGPRTRTAAYPAWPVLTIAMSPRSVQ